MIGASVGLRYGGTAGAWAGSVLGGGAHLVVAAAPYRKLVPAATGTKVLEAGRPKPSL